MQEKIIYNSPAGRPILLGDRVTSMHANGTEADKWHATVVGFSHSHAKNQINVVIDADHDKDLKLVYKFSPSAVQHLDEPAQVEFALAYRADYERMTAIHAENKVWLQKSARLAPKVSRDDYDDVCAYER